METPNNTADVSWDEQDQPFSRHFQDVYFSRNNGLAETQYVFIEQNDLTRRWSSPLATTAFTIAETGFGTGLNFLAAWQHWQQLNPQTSIGNAAQLHFISVEKFPLTRADLDKAQSLWPDLSDYAQQLLAAYPPQPATGVHRLHFENSRITLTLFFGDAADGFHQFSPCSTNGKAATNALLGERQIKVDAWFLDGFAPAKNPDMWTPALFAAMATLSTPHTTFATFTASGAVRRGLQAAGFNCQKVAGFGSKREMLRGNYTDTPAADTPPPPRLQRGDRAHHFWHLQIPQQRRAEITVIGGGLAGCQVAYALALRGLQVTLLERETQLATAASGNRQGVVYTRPSPHHDPLNQFNLAAQVYANHFYSRPRAQGDFFATCGARCGVLHLAMNTNQASHYQALAERYSDDPTFCDWLSVDHASEFAGVPLRHPALRIRSAGWLSPAQLCQQLVHHPNIQVRYNTEVADLNFDGTNWEIRDCHSKIHYKTPLVVIANAYAARQLTVTESLPLKQIRGQVTHLPADPALRQLRTVICGDGYVSPAQNALLCVGASFNLNDANRDLTERDHYSNLNHLASMLARENTPIPLSTLAGRVGFRTTTPDYFPLVGPVPVVASMKTRFEQLRYKSNAHIDSAGDYYPGLYTLLGLGSRGLAYAPLAAETLAALITGETLPLTQALYLKLHPARFLIRDLIRNKASTLQTDI